MKTLKTIYCRLKFASLAILVINLILASFVFAAQPARVVVIPLKMNAERDLGFLQDGIFDMLATRLSHPGKVNVVGKEKTLQVSGDVSGPVNEQYAKTVGSRLDADYVLFGSLTVFGNSVSLDAKLLDMSETTPTLSLFRQSQSMDDVIPAINDFAQEINQKVFGKQETVGVAGTTPRQGQAQPPAQSIYAHPERMWEEEAGRQGMIPSTGSPFIFSRSADLAGFQKSRNFEFEAEGLAVADLTGDGLKETVIMAGQSLHIFRNQGGRMAEMKEIKGERYHRYISVDAADTNGNGLAEIFVTCLNSNTKGLDSFVLQWDGSGFQTVAKNQKWYFRVIDHPLEGQMLVGQRRGIGVLFLDGIFHLVWDGRDYVGYEKLPVPRGTLVYGFAMGNPTGEGDNMVVALEPKGQVKIYGPGGNLEWKSSERYGGSENDLRYVGGDMTESESRMFLPQRVFLVDSNQNNRYEVLVVKNDAFTGKLFKNYRLYSSGTFQALTWDGLGLTPLWQTQKISGYISDYCLADMNNDGTLELVATVVSRRDALFRTPKSTVIWYDLSLLAEEKR